MLSFLYLNGNFFVTSLNFCGCGTNFPSITFWDVFLTYVCVVFNFVFDVFRTYVCGLKFLFFRFLVANFFSKRLTRLNKHVFKITTCCMLSFQKKVQSTGVKYHEPIHPPIRTSMVAKISKTDDLSYEQARGEFFVRWGWFVFLG